MKKGIIAVLLVISIGFSFMNRDGGVSNSIDYNSMVKMAFALDFELDPIDVVCSSGTEGRCFVISNFEPCGQLASSGFKNDCSFSGRTGDSCAPHDCWD